MAEAQYAMQQRVTVRACAPVDELLHERAELLRVVGRDGRLHRQRLHHHALAGRMQRVKQGRQQDVQMRQHLQRQHGGQDCPLIVLERHPGNWKLKGQSACATSWSSLKGIASG